jgi:hypothetical protein
MANAGMWLKSRSAFFRIAIFWSIDRVLEVLCSVEAAVFEGGVSIVAHGVDSRESDLRLDDINESSEDKTLSDEGML